MRPINFLHANKTFTKPDGMTDDECGPLPVYTDGQYLISCWKPSFKDRLIILLGKSIWLWILGKAHPPVKLTTDNPFTEEK